MPEKGDIGYVEMSKRLADGGMGQWMFDAKEMAIVYLDKLGNTILKECIRNDGV